MMPELPKRIHPSLNSFGDRKSMVSALEILGVDAPGGTRQPLSRRKKDRWGKPGRAGFWLRNEQYLDDIAYEARKAYIARMKVAHPDKGGTNDEADRIETAFIFVKKQLRDRGVKM